MKKSIRIPVPYGSSLKRKHLKIINKALVQGFYYRFHNKIIKASQDLTHLICVHYLGYDVELCYIHWKKYYKMPIQSVKEFSLDTYGEFWALTKKELQKS